MLSVTCKTFMLSIIMLSVIILSVVMLNVVMLSAVAPKKCYNVGTWAIRP